MPEAESLDQQKLLLERDRLRLDRQKAAIDARLRRSELARPHETLFRSLLANPIALAVVGGFITLMSSIVTTAYTSSQTNKAEALRATYARESAHDSLQADLIKKFVEGPSPAAIRENLKFLVDSGLIPTYATEISKYLAANPDTAPQLGALGGIIGADDAVPVASLADSDPRAPLSQGVGRLLSPDGGSVCTAFLVGPSLVLTAGHCVRPDAPDMVYVTGDSRIAARVRDRQVSGSQMPNYALLDLAQPVPSSTPPLELDAEAPAQGDRISIVLYRADPTQLTVACEVKAVAAATFEHTSDTGPGASGAPVFSSEGKVLGIHGGRIPSFGWATRAEVVKPLIAGK